MEGLDASISAAAAEAEAAAAPELKFEDFPSAPVEKVVAVDENGLAKEKVPSVADAAMGLREEEALLG